MSKELVDSKMDEAYQLIENNQFLDAVYILKQLKIKCPPDLIKDVKEWEKNKDKTLEKVISNIEEEHIHQFDKENKMNSKVKDYSWDYYMFYNRLRRENEIY